MQRLRPSDWLCGLAALALLVVLIVAGEGWDDLGWFTAGAAALAIAAGLACPFLTATRQSPTGPVLAEVAGLVLGLVASIALLAEGAWAGLAAAVALLVGAFLAMKDERQPGAVERPIERRPAPAPTIEA
jgi:hypothetical protein